MYALKSQRAAAVDFTGVDYASGVPGVRLEGRRCSGLYGYVRDAGAVAVEEN